MDCGSSRVSLWLRGRWQRLLCGNRNELCSFTDLGLPLPSEHGWSWRWAVPKLQAEPQLSSRLEVCLVWFLPSYKSSVMEVVTRSISPSHGSNLCQLRQERRPEWPLQASSKGSPAGSAFSSYKSIHAANGKFQIQAKHSLLRFHHPCGYSLVISGDLGVNPTFYAPLYLQHYLGNN